MSKILNICEGNLVVKCVHEGSGAEVQATSRIGDTGSDASFSPTDLVGAALGACALNVMGAYALKHDIDITGATAEVTKESTPNLGPIASLKVVFRMPPKNYSDREKKALQNCVRNCPVHKSLAPHVEQEMIFEWQ